MRRGPAGVGVKVVVPLHTSHREAAWEAAWEAAEAAGHPEAELRHRALPRRLLGVRVGQGEGLGLGLGVRARGWGLGLGVRVRVRVRG